MIKTECKNWLIYIRICFLISSAMIIRMMEEIVKVPKFAYNPFPEIEYRESMKIPATAASQK